MNDWTHWQAALAAIGPIAALALSVRLRRLCRRIAAVELATHAPSPFSEQQVSVAELLAREDAVEQTKRPSNTRPTKPASSARNVETTIPMPRPRQVIRLGPPPKATEEEDPGPWFRPALPPPQVSSQPARTRAGRQAISTRPAAG